MHTHYLQLFERQNYRRFVASGAFMRLPTAMLSVGIVLLVTRYYDSYGLAGLVAGVYGLTSALSGPVLGRLVDRYGQRRVMGPALTVHTTAIITLAGAAFSHAPSVVLLILGGLIGSTMGSLGVLVRARWVHVLSRDERETHVSRAFSLESMIDEVLYTGGPLLVTTGAAILNPALTLAGAGVLVGVSSYIFLSDTQTEPTPSGQAAGRAPRGLLTLMGAFALMGGVLGTLEVGLVAFSDHDRAGWVTGVGLAVVALASLAGSLVLNKFEHINPATRLNIALGVLGLGALLLVLAHNPLGVLSACAVLGLGLAPTIISGNEIAHQRVNSSQLTEGLALIMTAMGLGVSAGITFGGVWINHAGLAQAFNVVAVAGILTLSYAGLSARKLKATQVRTA